MNKDHVAAGGVATLVATNLPAVLAYYQHQGAPVNQETALIICAGAVLYGLFQLWRSASAAWAATKAQAAA